MNKVPMALGIEARPNSCAIIGTNKAANGPEKAPMQPVKKMSREHAASGKALGRKPRPSGEMDQISKPRL